MGFSFGTPEKVVFEKERCGELLQTDAYINGKFVKEKLIISNKLRKCFDSGYEFTEFQGSFRGIVASKGPCDRVL